MAHVKLVALAAVLLLAQTRAPGQVMKVTPRQYHPMDLVLRSSVQHENPFFVNLSAEFSGPQGERLTVLGFYDGADTWRVRFAPPVPGEWTYRTRSDDPQLNGKTGRFTCLPNDDPNVHGRLRVDPEHPHHFVWEDGTRYFLLGFEADWIWAVDLGREDISNLRRFIEAIARHRFNHIIMNVYAHDCPWTKGKTSPWDYGPPAMFAWAGSNDNPNHSRLNVAFFRHYDRLMNCLFEKGIVAHIMLRVYNKMVRWPKNKSPEDWLYYRYVIARYAAYPNVIWDFSKEAHSEKDAQYKLEVLRRIRQWDPYDNLITVHDDNAMYDSGRYNELLDFRSDQQHRKWAEIIRKQRAQRNWPVVNVEYGYERGVEDLPTYRVKQDWREVLRRTWEIYLAGGYCNYYYSNTSWDLIKWEPEPPGWRRYAILYDFFQRTRYWEMEPADELVSAGRCLAKPGEQYVVFLEQGRETTLRIAGAARPLSLVWLDPYTGREVAGAALGNGRHTLRIPAELSPPAVAALGVAREQ